MATRITGQEALNALAGFTSPLRTKQECLNSLAGLSGALYTSGHAWNVYAGTSGEQAQIAANVKASSPANVMRTKQDCANIVDGILV